MYGDLYRDVSKESSRRAKEGSPNPNEPVLEDYITDILYRPKNFGRLPLPGEEDLVLSRLVAKKVECAAGTAADKNRREIEDDMIAIEMAIRRAGRERVMLSRALNMSSYNGIGNGKLRRLGGGASGGIMGRKRKRNVLETHTSEEEEKEEDSSEIEEEDEVGLNEKDVGVVLEMDEEHVLASTEEEEEEEADTTEETSLEVEERNKKRQRRSTY